MVELSCLGTSKKDFYNFISSLINCVRHTQLSNASANLKTILHDKRHDAHEKT